MTFQAIYSPHRTAATSARPFLPVYPLANRPFAAEILALRAEGVRLKSTESTAIADIHNWCERAQDCLSVLSVEAPAEIPVWQEAILPLFMSSAFLKRCREQPRGYAGDYLTIQLMYDAVPVSDDPFGRAIDSWSMQQPCPRAVRNRRDLVRSFLERVSASFDAPQVVSLGCGPAAEVFDLVTASNARFALVDIDTDALRFVRDKAEATATSARIGTVKANVIKMLVKDRGELPDNCAGIYSLGLIDYFSDDLVVRLLDLIHAKLATGGMAFLGNFRPGHPNAALFEHALNWPLVLRSEAELRELVARSKFAQSFATVGTESEGVQLFLECRK